jgi:hypothetical protein
MCNKGTEYLLQRLVVQESMDRNVHKVSIRVHHSYLGKRCSVRTFLDFFIWRMFPDFIQSLVTFSLCIPEMIEPASALLQGRSIHPLGELSSFLHGLDDSLDAGL